MVSKYLYNIIVKICILCTYIILLYFLCREPNVQSRYSTPTFRCRGDWEKELKRTKCIGWTLSTSNNSFQLSER